LPRLEAGRAEAATTAAARKAHVPRARRAAAARLRALNAPPASASYVRAWNRSVVDAREALTLLQDIRDRARLIPLPEDSIS
jgi:hypothetical protein